MSSAARPGGSSRPILAVAVLGCVQFLAAGSAVIFAFREPVTAASVGPSSGRIAVAILACLASLSILAVGLLLTRSRLTFRALRDGVPASLGPWLVAAGILTVGLGWIAAFTPPYVFGERAGYFSRLRPLLLAAALFVIEIWLGIQLSRGAGSWESWRRSLHVRPPRAFYAAFLCLFIPWLLMLISGFGIKKISPFWNPPGVPLTAWQTIGVFCLIGAGALFVNKTAQARTPQGRRVLGWAIAAAIYVCAVLVWGLTPMQRHYFSLRPAAPSFQPFPFSDARSHDLGALSIITGQGVYFHGFTDKPLYMVFLAFLHWLGGDDYVLLTWLQLGVLACIPVMLFQLGRQFHSEFLGAAIALMMILQQANSIHASLDIDSVNPRLLMTEVPTLLGMVLIAYLLFRWFRTRRPSYALASGAAIGAASLIRANPLILLPLAGICAALVLPRQRRLMCGQLLLFCAGFLVVFSPWLVTGVNEAGVPWLWVKFKFVIGQRLQSMESSTPRAAMPVPQNPRFTPWETTGSLAYAALGGPSWSALNTGLKDGGQVILSEQSQDAPVLPFVPRTLSNTLHNMAAALLSLPDMFVLENLHQLSQRDPWGNHTWQGNLTPAQHVAAVVNLVLLATGLVWSWQRFRLPGLVPAIVFLGYDLSLAVAATSGGRYVVPINWVAHFYYVLGWIAIVEALPRSRVAAALDNSAPPALADGTRTRSSLLPAAAAVVFVAALLPFANVVLPVLVQTRVEERARAELAAASPTTAPGVELAYGKVVYPYYHPRTRSISFHLLTDTGYVSDLTVVKDDVFPPGAVRSGSLGLVGVSKETGRRVAFLYVAGR